MATDIGEMIKKWLDEGYEEEVTPASIQLKNNARTFLEDIANSYENITQINMIEARRNQLKNQIKSLQKKMADEKNAGIVPTLSNQLLDAQGELEAIKRSIINQAEFNQFISKVFNFQEKLNEFIGQQAKTIFVYTDSKNNITLYEMTAEGAHALKGELASKGAGVTGRYRFSKKILENKKNAKKLATDNLNFSLEGLQKAYKESLNRGNYKKSARKKGGLLIFWQPSGSGWKKIFISTAGDLGESYAAYFIANLKSPDFKDAYIDNLLDQFLLGDSYIYDADKQEYISKDSRSAQQVDNISGLLEGDVSTKIGDKNIEYAIKAKGASMLSYEQVITLAKAIDIMPANQINKIFLEGIKQQLHDAGHTRNVSTRVEACIENTWQDMIEEYLLSENVTMG